MSITVLFRLAMGLALAGAVGIGYARSRRMEAGEPRGDDRKDAVVYGDPNTFAFMIAAFALLAVFFDGPEQGSHLAVRMLLESAARLPALCSGPPVIPLWRRNLLSYTTRKKGVNGDAD